MKNKNTLRTGTKPILTLKRVVIYSAIIAIAGGLLWKFIIGTAAVTLPNAMFGQYTPANGPIITDQLWEKPIVVNHAKVMDTVDLIDFPLLVSITDPDLRSTTNGGYVANSNGYDIRFTGDGEKSLDHDIEKYNPLTGELVAWVKLPVLYHDVDTELKVSCGNTTFTTNQSTENVWDAGYKAIWHMSENPATTELNDAAGNLDAVSHGNMQASCLANGMIGDAIQFDGTNDYFSIKNKYYLGNNQIPQITVSAWVKTDWSGGVNYNSNWSLLDFDRTKYFNVYIHGNGMASFSTSGTSTNDLHAGVTGQLNDNNWHHIAASYDGTNKYVYIDGVLVGTAANAHNGNGLGTTTKRYGMIGDGSKATSYNGTRYNIYYKGWIDELRLSEQLRSTGWILTEYNNQSSPETFYTLGAANYLPIELVFFHAALDEERVVVDWATASQTNNDYFTIERSVDGKTFENLIEIDGLGSSQSYKAYQWIDENPRPGLSYYRLRQTDFDGKTEVFNSVSVNYIKEIEGLQIESVYPNPFTEFFTLRYTTSSESEIDIMLVNNNGTRVFSDVQFSKPGSNFYEFASNGMLTPGVYFLQLSNGNEILATKKLIKK